MLLAGEGSGVIVGEFVGSGVVDFVSAGIVDRADTVNDFVGFGVIDDDFVTIDVEDSEIEFVVDGVVESLEVLVCEAVNKNPGLNDTVGDCVLLGVFVLVGVLDGELLKKVTVDGDPERRCTRKRNNRTIKCNSANLGSGYANTIKINFNCSNASTITISYEGAKWY